MVKALTAEEVLALPAAPNLVLGGMAYGFGRTKAYDLARRGEFPVPVLRIGQRYRVRRADILASLDIADEPQADRLRLLGVVDGDSAA